MKKYLIIALLAALGSGKTAAQRISFANQTVTTKATLWKKPVTAVFHYTNKERTPLVITAVDGGCGCVATEWSKDELARGEEGEIRVTYDAKTLGKFDKVIEVYTNGSDEPTHIRMKGLVSNGDIQTLADLYPYQMGDILLNTTEVQFPSVYAGDSVTATIEIANEGNEVYTPQLMHLPSYISVECQPEMLARGQRGKILLTLHSDKLLDLGLNQTNVYLSRHFGDKVGDGNDIVISAVLLPDLHNVENSANAPQIHLSTTDVNLGKLGNKKKLIGKVKITNKGNKTLTLNKIQAFNQAVTVELKKSEITPGNTADMIITVESRYLGMSKAQPRVLIVSNDPKQPMVVINVNYSTNDTPGK